MYNVPTETAKMEIPVTMLPTSASDVRTQLSVTALSKQSARLGHAWNSPIACAQHTTARPVS